MPISNAFNRDCIEALKDFPDGYFDLLLADVPYGINITVRHKAENAGGAFLVGKSFRPFGGVKRYNESHGITSTDSRRIRGGETSYQSLRQKE